MVYKLLKRGVLRLADGVRIMPSRSSPDWRAYLAYRAAGGVVQPADPVAPAPLPDDEVAARYSRQRLTQDREEAREYQKLKAMRNMTPAEVGLWVDANVTTFAQAKDAIRTLAIAVCILSRRI